MENMGKNENMREQGVAPSLVKRFQSKKKEGPSYPKKWKYIMNHGLEIDNIPTKIQRRRSKVKDEEHNLVYEKYREVERSEGNSKKVQPITALIISAIEKELKRSKKDQIVLERDYFSKIITNRCDAQIRSYLKQIDHLYEIKVYRDRYSICRNDTQFPLERSDNYYKPTLNVYNFTQDNWLQIKRSNDYSKTIQAVCIYYISTIEFCFKKNKERNLVIIPSSLLHKNNQVGKGQRREQIKQLADLYDIKYHRFLFFEGKRYSEVYTAERTNHCLEILNDPDLFYQKKEKTWVNHSSQIERLV